MRRAVAVLATAAFAALALAGPAGAGATTEPAQNEVGGDDPVVTAAGDICGTPTDCRATAALVRAIDPQRALTLGDNEQNHGTLAQFRANYAPNWGAFLAKTSPAPGNHEYRTAGAAGYFTYFGARAPAAYYSFDIGTWHLVSLDSEIPAGRGSAQETWFKADLAAHPRRCTLTYWHKPRWSSGYFGPIKKMDQLWRDAYAAHVDVVLSGHDHIYERFAPRSGTGAFDAAGGIRQFVVGTGGWAHGPYSTIQPYSQVRNKNTFGVLKLTLHPQSYDWRFVPVAGATFTDSGSTTCH